eukprot:SAG31_NODE_3304_length_4439_cov_2.067742_3_plen_590_part_00
MNPADMPTVIGVGGLEDDGSSVASFSSRGMTNWELPFGYGRVKPDVMAYSRRVHGTDMHGGCKFLCGTSVASPAVAGAVALLASSVEEDQWKTMVTPASMKQVLIEGAMASGANALFEEGAGLLNVVKSAQLLREYTPRASLYPDRLDMTDCPRFWPWCTQPVYATQMPVVINVTILNGLGPTGRVVGSPTWIEAQNGHLIMVETTHSEILWPWFGWLAVSIRARPEAAGWTGTAEGQLQLRVTGSSDGHGPVQVVTFDIRVPVVPQPPRLARLLWDQVSSIQYPPGYIPRDSLDQLDFDWHSDHPHTNYRGLYAELRATGYFVEILTSPAGLLGFDATLYAALFVVDPEEEFTPAEIGKLHQDIGETGLSLVVAAEWYDHDVLKSLRYRDELNGRWWQPVTGGSNLPALNELLAPYGIEFAAAAAEGTARIELDGDRHELSLVHGVPLARFPANGRVATARLFGAGGESLGRRPVIGLAQLPLWPAHSEAEVSTLGDPMNTSDFRLYAKEAPNIIMEDDDRMRQRRMQHRQNGYILAFGDTHCLDDSHRTPDNTCFWLITKLLQRMAAQKDPGAFGFGEKMVTSFNRL